MSADMDPDLALVRKLHLELNGSGRRTRGAVLPPVKKVKREASRPLDEALKDSSSVSISGSGSGSGKMLKREGTLRRLVKKQPNSDSNQDTAAGQRWSSTQVNQNQRPRALQLDLQRMAKYRQVARDLARVRNIWLRRSIMMQSMPEACKQHKPTAMLFPISIIAQPASALKQTCCMDRD